MQLVVVSRRTASVMAEAVRDLHIIRALRTTVNSVPSLQVVEHIEVSLVILIEESTR